LQATNRFSPVEIEVALELIDIYLNQPQQKDYRFYCAGDESEIVAGYVCFGPTPMTEGTYDLYWIAVDPERQRQGVGDLLLAFVEAEVQREHGRLLMIETSSQPKYDPTHFFYRKHHYREIARIPDFYAEADDRVIYCKKLRNEQALPNNSPKMHPSVARLFAALDSFDFSGLDPEDWDNAKKIIAENRAKSKQEMQKIFELSEQGE